MLKVAVVFGFSDQGEYLAKRIIMSFCENVLGSSKGQYQMHIHPYRCNFEIMKFKKFNKGLRFLESPPTCDTYQFSSAQKSTNWSDLDKWEIEITEHDCSLISNFVPSCFPDIAVYHDFATKHSNNFDYVAYCHNDIEFIRSKTGNLDAWTEIVGFDSEYSIIAELRATSNYNISIRFHTCFVFVNSDKFRESQLSFINDLKLIDPSQYHVYSNGGNGLLASFYRRKDNKPLHETQWRPYLLDIHGIYRGKEIISTDKWFNHVGEVEWNRHMPLSEGSSIQRTENEYKKAKEYVLAYKQRHGTIG